MSRIALICSYEDRDEYLPDEDILRELVCAGARTVVHDPNKFLRGGNFKKLDKIPRHISTLISRNKSIPKSTSTREFDDNEKIALFHTRKLPVGGTTSFTIHLYVAMKMAGIDVK